jgi:hypothetical protein
LKRRTSSSTHFDLAASGEQITTSESDASSASMTALLRSELLDSSARSMKIGTRRSGMLSLPTPGRSERTVAGTLKPSNERCSQRASAASRWL